jgi:hypothetical protein
MAHEVPGNTLGPLNPESANPAQDSDAAVDRPQADPETGRQIVLPQQNAAVARLALLMPNLFQDAEDHAAHQRVGTPEP